MLWLQKGTAGGLLILAILVGIGGAIGATVFHFLIALSTTLFFGHTSGSDFIETVTALSVFERLLIPTLGGLLVGIIFTYVKVTEAEGEGVPEVMEALAHRRGTIRPIVAPVKILTAAITLGSGGSAGREGPIIQIGSAIGSSIGQLFRLDAKKRSLLLAAGAAAGIGGTFGAPVAGFLFTIEILRQQLTVLRGSVIIVAAIIGTYGAQLLTGGTGLRFILEQSWTTSLSLAAALITLGLLSVCIALGFGIALTRTRQLFQKISLPFFLKPALGGFLIGLIGLYLPHIHEPAAYPLTIDLLQLASIPALFLIILLVVKILATAITLGSGGSGGIFAPLLLTGAITGSILGQLLLAHQLIDASTASLLVAIGMASVFAAAAHAPLTASFIMVEMTENLSLLPLLLGACFLASFVTRRLNRTSVYSLPHQETQ